MSIAMSITAFPVLARIIQEQELTRTQLGTLAITCAAVDAVYNSMIYMDFVKGKAGSVRSCSDDDGASLPVLMEVE
jgi:Kef-type K+ transport system membrane component KefB